MAKSTIIFILVLLTSVVSAQDIGLLAVKTIYLAPSDSEKALKQLRERLPAESGWKIVFDLAQADAVLGISRSAGQTKYWTYNPPAYISGTATSTGYSSGTVHTSLHATITQNPTVTIPLTDVWEHIVIYDAKTGGLLFKHSSNLRWRWGDGIGSFLKRLKRDLVVLNASGQVKPSAGLREANVEQQVPPYPRVRLDVINYGKITEHDGHVWKDLPDEAKFAYLAGYQAALMKVDSELRDMLAEAEDIRATSPLIAASRTENHQRKQIRQAMNTEVNNRVEESTTAPNGNIKAALDRFYGAPENEDVPILDAIRILSQ
jgi:hypothetical protein